jgi:hypothetical protein
MRSSRRTASAPLPLMIITHTMHSWQMVLPLVITCVCVNVTPRWQVMILPGSLWRAHRLCHHFPFIVMVYVCVCVCVCDPRVGRW